jgi:hypothetical protein
MVLILTAGLSAYLLVGSIPRPGAPTVSTGDVAAYRTRSDTRLGLYGTVAAEYGFWRREPPLPRDDVPGWIFVFGALLLVVVLGAWKELRAAGPRAAVARAILLSGVVGYFLALGDRGFTGSVYLFLFRHLPGFEVLREPQKFIALPVLAYAYFFGWGASALVQSATSRAGRAAMAAVALVIPVAYNPSLFWGLWNRIQVSHFPQSWSTAEQQMGSGRGQLLMLPWHLYMAYPFTDARTVVNPAGNYFERPVITGDDPELRTVTPTSLDRSRFIRFVLANGYQVHTFGQLVAPLGVEYVALAKTADWPAYSWLNQQRDLTVVLDRPDLTVWRNTAATAPGIRTTGRVVLDDWGALLGTSDQTDLSNQAVFVRHAVPGPIRAVPVQPEVPTVAALGQPQKVRYTAHQSDGAWAILPEAFDPSWRSPSGTALLGASGEAIAPVRPDKSATIQFRFWRILLLGYVVSGGTLVACLASLGWIKRREGITRQSRSENR